jgi:hypothetical protein
MLTSDIRHRNVASHAQRVMNNNKTDTCPLYILHINTKYKQNKAKKKKIKKYKKIKIEIKK